MPDTLRAQYLARIELLEKLRPALEQETIDALDGLPHVDRISFRVKTPDSFATKAANRDNDSPYADPLTEIEDQVAGRVIVFFVSDIAIVRERLAGTFTTVERTYRRPERDAEFGYESDHLICVIPPMLKPDGWVERPDVPTTFELQIRTIFMHAYAEPQHDIAYKAARELPLEIRRELAWVAGSAWGGDQAFERIRSWSEHAESR